MMTPQLAAWQATYGAQGLSVIGFTDDAVPIATANAQAWGMTYAVGSDVSGATGASYGVMALPTMFLIDKKGVIREVWTGFDPARHREMEKAFQALLAEPL
jgi:peroxiredoxin